MSNRADLVIVCDHGVSGGALAEVVRYVWPKRIDPYRAHWGNPVVAPSGRVVQTDMTGDKEGVNPFSTEHLLDELRVHHEIICLGESCRVLPYRADVAKLQTLFDVIATDQRFRIFVESFGATSITVTLAGLHRARDTAKQRCGLPV